VQARYLYDSLETLAGEPFDGSGFEQELPEPDFDEEKNA